MAVTVEGARLTEAHRVAQLDTQAQSAETVVTTTWPLLDTADLDASFPVYARATVAAVDAGYAESISTASAYLGAFRAAEGVAGVADIARAAALESAQVLTSLLVTGPITIKRAIRSGLTPAAARDRGLAATTGAVIRLVATGGRGTIRRTVARDGAALGYARVTDGDPCYFCAMLAGRGPVYQSQRSALVDDAGEAYHDGCGCTVEPVYSRRDYRWPGGDQAREWAALWESATAGTSGKDARNAFRAAYESSRRTGGTPSA